MPPLVQNPMIYPGVLPQPISPVRPAGSSKAARPTKTYTLSEKVSIGSQSVRSNQKFLIFIFQEKELKEKWEAESALKASKKASQKEKEEYMLKIRGPIAYMIIGVLLMVTVITILIKIIYFKKRQIRKTEKDIQKKLSDDNTVHQFNS